MRKRNGKYGAVKTTIDGIVFDSRSEARRYTELLMLAGAGVISELETHPTYILQPAYARDGHKYAAVTYTADFQYLEDGALIVEDVKGFRTAAFNLKKRIFDYRYPGIKLRLVEA